MTGSEFHALKPGAKLLAQFARSGKPENAVFVEHTEPKTWAVVMLDNGTKKQVHWSNTYHQK